MPQPFASSAVPLFALLSRQTYASETSFARTTAATSSAAGVTQPELEVAPVPSDEGIDHLHPPVAEHIQLSDVRPRVCRVYQCRSHSEVDEARRLAANIEDAKAGSDGSCASQPSDEFDVVAEFGALEEEAAG
eukprot:6172995-Pleurochrysis_carterae.AAC.2